MSSEEKEPFRRKYFDEAFPEWFVFGGSSDDDEVCVDDGTNQLACLKPEQADIIIERHNAVINTLWDAVKYDYDLFTKLRDGKDV